MTNTNVRIIIIIINALPVFRFDFSPFVLTADCIKLHQIWGRREAIIGT